MTDEKIGAHLLQIDDHLLNAQSSLQLSIQIEMNPLLPGK